MALSPSPPPPHSHFQHERRLGGRLKHLVQADDALAARLAGGGARQLQYGHLVQNLVHHLRSPPAPPHELGRERHAGDAVRGPAHGRELTPGGGGAAGERVIRQVAG